MPTTRNPGVRTQADISKRLRMRLDSTDPIETRQITLAHVIDVATSSDAVSDDDPNRGTYTFPANPPTRTAILQGLVKGEAVYEPGSGEWLYSPSMALPGVLNLARKLRDNLDQLAEYAWVLCHDTTSEQMVAPGEHHEVGLVALMSIVRFCDDLGIPLPMEAGDGTTLAADLQEARDALQAEADAIGDQT